MTDFDAICEVIRKTRDTSLPHFGSAEITHKKSTLATDVVTKTDHAVEQFLCTEFAKVDPSITFVGEEFGGDRNAERFWLVDPVDGTGTYIRGLPFCTTMVALIEHGEVTFSAIYDFVGDVLYHAIRGNGAFANEEKISVSQRPFAGSYIGYESRVEKEENLQKYMEVRKRCGMLKFMCAGYEFTLVATGKLEARVQYDPYGKDYDFAPGNLLVAEAGGVVANVGSNLYDYKNVNSIAANPIVYKELTEGPDALFPVIE